MRIIFTQIVFSVFGMMLGLAGCSREDLPNVELIQGMMEDPGYKTQEYDPHSPTQSAMRLPPEGTVPRGFKPYLYKGQPEKAAEELKNPRSGDFTPAHVARGQEKYEIYCGLCHGQFGKRSGLVGERMPWPPPPLISQKVRDFSDGRIYHIITDGQGVMGSYANQISPEDRWAIVNYVRNLQKITQGR